MNKFIKKFNFDVDSKVFPSEMKLKDGRLLAYCEYGDQKGKPVFFFHGWPGSRLSGKETDEAAKKLGVRVISPDRPGFGLSGYQENRTLLGWADDVLQLADYLNINKFAVLGVSGGGPYTAAVAYKLTDRITRAGIVVGLAPTNIPGNLEGIAMVNKFSWYSYRKFPITISIAARIAAIEFKHFPIVAKLAGFQAKEDKEILKNKKTFESAREAFRQGVKGAELDLKLYTDGWGFDLKQIKVPVYLWYGAKDKNVSLNMGKYYHAQVPNSQLFIDPDGGHLARYQFEEKILKTLLEPSPSFR